MLLSGLWWTLGVAACSWIIAMLFGSVIGTLRTTDSRVLVFLGNAWVELFRNIPLLVQMFLWYFVVPELVPPLKAWVVAAEPSHAQFLSATLCLGLFTSARIAEQVRAGIQSLPRGQRYAAQAIGLTTTQMYRFVLLPMAVPILMVVFVLAFIGTIIEYPVASILLREEPNLTLAVGSKFYLYEQKYLWGDFAAAAVLSGLPITLVFLLAQRWIVSGLTSGGV